MARADSAQLNIRSKFAHERASQIARATGMTRTQVIEDALRAYVPPAEAAPVGRLVRKGRLLVLPSKRMISHEEADAAIEASRTRELFYDED